MDLITEGVGAPCVSILCLVPVAPEIISEAHKPAMGNGWMDGLMDRRQNIESHGVYAIDTYKYVPVTINLYCPLKYNFFENIFKCAFILANG